MTQPDPCHHDWRTVATVTRHTQQCARCQQERTVSARPPCPDDISLDLSALTADQRRENVALTVQVEQERSQVDEPQTSPYFFQGIQAALRGSAPTHNPHVLKPDSEQAARLWRQGFEEAAHALRREYERGRQDAQTPSPQRCLLDHEAPPLSVLLISRNHFADNQSAAEREAEVLNLLAPYMPPGDTRPRMLHLSPLMMHTAPAVRARYPMIDVQTAVYACGDVAVLTPA